MRKWAGLHVVIEERQLRRHLGNESATVSNVDKCLYFGEMFLVCVVFVSSTGLFVALRGTSGLKLAVPWLVRLSVTSVEVEGFRELR